jgi:hypothetical protein
MTQHQGKCLCGKVTFSIEIEKKEASHCHCEMCRTWSAGTLLMAHGHNAPKVQDESALGVYSSSDWGERCFCKHCGSNLFWRAKDGSFYGTSVNALEDTQGFTLSAEIFIDHKPDYSKATEQTQLMTAQQFWEMVESGSFDAD